MKKRTIKKCPLCNGEMSFAHPENCMTDGCPNDIFSSGNDINTKIKVKELIKKLHTYNSNADISIIVDNKPYNFTLSFGSSEGCTKKNCENVSFYIEELNKNELK